MKGLGLEKMEIAQILEGALRHTEHLTKEALIEAIATVIIENNKKIEKAVIPLLESHETAKAARRRGGIF